MIEVRIRKFFKTEDGELTLTPSIVMLARSEVPTLDISKSLTSLNEMVADLPEAIGPIREMTEAEVTALLEREDAE